MWHFTPQAPRAPSHYTGYPSLEYVDEIMDNCILLAPGPLERHLKVRQILLECLDSGSDH